MDFYFLGTTHSTYKTNFKSSNNFYSNFSKKNITNNFLRLGTVNIRGRYAGKKEELVEELNSYKLDLLGICDTRTRGEIEESVGRKGDRVYLSGVKKGRADAGVGIVVSRRIEAHLLETGKVSDRIMWARFRFNQINVRVVVVYAPCEGAKEEAVNNFYACLEGVVSNSGDDSLIIIGDFNGRIGCNNAGVEDIMGSFGEQKEANKNGKRLIDFCAGIGLVITNSVFKHKDIHKYTWEEPARKRKSIIDYILVSKDLRRYVMNTRVFRGFEIESDHYMVGCTLRINGFVIGDKGNHQVKCTRIKTEAFKDDSIQEQFREGVVKGFYDKDGAEKVSGVEEEWNNYRDTLVNVGKKVLGETVCKSGKRRTPWWSDYVREKVQEKKKAFKKWLKTRTEQDLKDYRQKRNAASKVVANAKECSWEEFGNRIERAGMEGGNLLWGTIRTLRNGKKEMMSNVKDKEGNIIIGTDKVMGRWTECYSELLNVEDGTSTDDAQVLGGRYESGKCNNIYGEDDISLEEVRIAVGKIKCGKAAGVDEVKPELIKYSGETGLRWLHRIISMAWNFREVPLDWRKGVIAPIYKKGDKKDCNNYRPISLLSVPGKVYASVLEARLRSIVEEQLEDNQCGFRPMRGCQDQIFSIRQLIEKCYEKNKDIYTCFVDLEKAYDRIPRVKLFSILKRYGVGYNLLSANRSIYFGSCAAVRIEGKLGEWFDVKTGVRQGCKLSPLLFIIYMNEILTNCRFEGDIKLNGTTIGSLVYADDLVIMSESALTLQKNIVEFSEKCKDFGMKISVAKTKVMKIGKSKSKVECYLDGVPIEQVQQFTYLGCCISEDGKLEEEISSRIMKANSVIAQVRNTIFRKKEVSKGTKLKIHRAIVRPILMYGSESWTDTGTTIHKIEVADMKVLRLISEVSRRDQWEDEISNEAIRRDLGINSIEEVARQARLRWYGHVSRMDNGRIPKALLDATLECKRGRGRPRRKWIDAVGNDLDCRDISWEEARDCVMNRAKWRRIVYDKVSVDVERQNTIG